VGHVAGANLGTTSGSGGSSRPDHQVGVAVGVVQQLDLEKKQQQHQ